MFLKFNNMNNTKRERIQKQLTKLLSKNGTLNVNIESSFRDMLMYILIQKTFIHYHKIQSLLNIDVNEVNNIDDINNIDSQLFDNYLSRLKNITLQDLDDSNLSEIKVGIKNFKEAIIMNEHKKTQMNLEIKKLRTEFSNRPNTILKQIHFEKQNLFNVINRINNLEENDNNNFIKEYDFLQEQILSLDNKIKETQYLASEQFKKLQNMRTQNLEIRNEKVKQIQNFKKAQLNMNKNRYELVKQRDINEKCINEHINQVNQIKFDIKTLKQNINEHNLIENNTKMNEHNEKIRYLLKKIDYFVKEKNRINTTIQIFDTTTHNSNNKEKVITKLEITSEKSRHKSLLLLVEKLKQNKTTLINNQKNLIIKNMDYNNILNKEYKRGEERILKVVSRINESFNNDKDILQKEINVVLEKIDNENMKKKDNLLHITKLENNIVESFKDINYLRKQLELINLKQVEIDKINTDISSYQKLLK